jgi:hypothetical protein
MIALDKTAVGDDPSYVEPFVNNALVITQGVYNSWKS